MNRLPTFSTRLFFPLILLLAMTVELTAPSRATAHAIEPRRSTTASGPVFGEWLEHVNIGRPSDRRTVVRVAAIGMALALFIMFRSKH